MEMPDGRPAVAPLSPDGRLRVLVVDVDGSVTSRLEAALDSLPERERFALSRASSLGETLEGLAASDADVVLLPISPLDQEGLGPLVTIRAEAPTLAIVVLCAAGDEPLAVKAVQLGATDYLVAEQLYGTLAARSLRHAVEVARVRTVLASYQAESPPPPGGAGTRPAPLRAAFPDRFAELARDYGEILDRAVQQILQRRPAALETRLQRLAGIAAELRAGPRDIVELHAAAMKQREAEHGPQRMKLYLAEGRVRLLELMGYLVTFYRDRWTGGPRAGAD
jgi:DNA-binding NarL/FixJ family response regulator